MPEYSIPIMFDVEAPTREAAGRALVGILAQLWEDRDWTTADAHVDSWWTIEAVDKRFDRNDNAAGEVVFDSSQCGNCGVAFMNCRCGAPISVPVTPPLLWSHHPRPGDLVENGSHLCRDCGQPIVWLGPNSSDWQHVEEPF